MGLCCTLFPVKLHIYVISCQNILHLQFAFIKSISLILSLYKDFVSVVSTAPNNIVIVSLMNQFFFCFVLSLLVNIQHHLFFSFIRKKLALLSNLPLENLEFIAFSCLCQVFFLFYVTPDNDTQTNCFSGNN